jgi:cellulose synthase/poly-beta-1,6-N-acetylglucosamine synthase-like glycosyltransferase
MEFQQRCESVADRLSSEKGQIEARPTNFIDGLVSIVVPCCGQLEMTRICVPSLLRHSRQPFEIIFVDVASLDGTADYLDGVAAGASVPVEIVRIETDRAISSGCVEALRQARGEYVVLLDNDTVVTPGWLDQMVSLSQLAPKVALVGPMSNCAMPPQLVNDVSYQVRFDERRRLCENILIGKPSANVAPLEEFARHWHR